MVRSKHGKAAWLRQSRPWASYCWLHGHADVVAACGELAELASSWEDSLIHYCFPKWCIGFHLCPLHFTVKTKSLLDLVFSDVSFYNLVLREDILFSYTCSYRKWKINYRVNLIELFLKNKNCFFKKVIFIYTWCSRNTIQCTVNIEWLTDIFFCICVVADIVCACSAGV